MWDMRKFHNIRGDFPFRLKLARLGALKCSSGGLIMTTGTLSQRGEETICVVIKRYLSSPHTASVMVTDFVNESMYVYINKYICMSVCLYVVCEHLFAYFLPFFHSFLCFCVMFNFALLTQ